MSRDQASHVADASSPVPNARRSEDGGMALVKAAVESANDAIIITEAQLDAPGPRIEYVNAAFTRMTGYGVEEIVGQTPRILQGPKTDPDLLKRLRVDLLTQESFHGETVNYRKDGAEYIVEWRITPLHDGEGKLSKFTPRNGRIEVGQTQSASADGEVSVTVCDNGQGIAEDFLPYIFDRFRQSDASASRRQGGLGLGLSIVKQLVELHGGTVGVASGGAGQGSIFTVTLPVGEAPSAVNPAPANAVHEPKPTESVPVPVPARSDGRTAVHDGHARGTALAGIGVLLLEDDADQRHLLRRVLEQQGAAVRVAEDADAGLALLRSERPHVLISDIGLPGVDGYEFLRRVRELPAQEGGRIPAIALTAFARAEDRQLALRAGFQTHVTKPAEATELINVIANLASLAK